MKKQKHAKTKNADVAKLPEDFWEKSEPGHVFLPKLFDRKNAENLMRGKVGRPVAENPGVRTSIRLWPEVDAYFRSAGKGWQTRINKALMEWVESHS